MRFENSIRAFCALLSFVVLPLRAEELTIPGTGDGMEIVKALAAAFLVENPQTIVNIPLSTGSGGGIAAVGTGSAIMGRVARSLTESERAQGIRLIPVFNVPSAIFVNPAAKINELSYQQLRAIYAGEITNWQEIGGPDLKIKIVRRENEDSTLNALRANMPGWKDLVITPRSKTDVTTQDAIRSVRDTVGAIGFGPFTNALGEGIVVLKIEGKDPAKPNYPCAVQVGLIFKDAALHPGAKAFMEFVQTAKAKAVISSFGAAPAGE